MSFPSKHGHGGLHRSGGGRAAASGDDKEERRRFCHRRGGEAPPQSAPPLPAPSTESSDDEYSYSSVELDSTDDGEELVKIVDPHELEARVLAKSVRSERRAAKRRRAEAEFVEVMNMARQEQGLCQDAEHTCRVREWEEVRRRQCLNQRRHCR